LTRHVAYATLVVTMNLRTTTPVSNSRTLKWGIAAIALVIIATAGIMWVSRPASADQYDDKIRALQADMSRYQAEANKLNAEASTLSNALAQITNEKNALQSQVDLSQNQYDKLIIQIADTEKQITENQNALGSTLASLYVDDNISPIEMIASSKDISEFLNKQEYRNSIKKELSGTINRVRDLKTQLVTQKSEVETVLATQKSARDALVAKEREQSNLLAQTQNNEAAYQGLIQASAAQIAQARATQAALSKKTVSTGGYNLLESGLLPEYVTDSKFGMWNNSNCPMVFTYMSSKGSNGNGGDNRGYGCRQCASYVAWKIYQEKGYWPSWGNASNFGSKGSSTSPKAGTVAVMYDGGPGHVAWVETDPYISSTGKLKGKSVIQITQYNFNYGSGYGMYSRMEVSVGFFDTYRQL
jgi:peptidoglycan hydrolase CwlO-like protein